MAKRGVHTGTTKEDLQRFDDELREYYANRGLYTFINPRDEGRSWIIRMKAKKICRSAKTLAEAVTVRNQMDLK